MSKSGTFLSPVLQVEPAWIDYNGHLNMAYYSVLFDRGVDALWDKIGFGANYRETRGGTSYAAEFHIRYLREIHQGDNVRVSFQLLDHSDKSWHFHQELIHQDGWVSATGEGLGLHIDTSGPKVAAMPADILAQFETLMQAQRDLPVPDHIGRQMAIRR